MPDAVVSQQHKTCLGTVKVFKCIRLWYWINEAYVGTPPPPTDPPTRARLMSHTLTAMLSHVNVYLLRTAAPRLPLSDSHMMMIAVMPACASWPPHVCVQVREGKRSQPRRHGHGGQRGPV